eukprot:g50808.t1
MNSTFRPKNSHLKLRRKVFEIGPTHRRPCSDLHVQDKRNPMTMFNQLRPYLSQYGVPIACTLVLAVLLHWLLTRRKYPKRPPQGKWPLPSYKLKRWWWEKGKEFTAPDPIAGPMDFMRRGDLLLTDSPLWTELVVSEATLAEEMLTQPEVFAKLHTKELPMRARIGNGLFTSDDDEQIWHVAHRILLPAFSADGMRQYHQIVMDCLKEVEAVLNKHADTHQSVDWHKLCSQFTTEVISRVGFGEPHNAIGREENTEFLNACEDFMSTAFWIKTAKRDLRFLMELPGRLRRDKQALQTLKSFCRDVIARRRAAIEKDPSLRSKQDIVTLMLTAKDPKTGEMLPEENILSQTITFMVAGHDSTSTALTMLFYRLAMSAQVEEKLLAEVAGVIGDNTPTFAHGQLLHYVEQVLKENLRMTTPAMRFVKTAAKDTTLGGYGLPKGTKVVCNIRGVHHNPKTWKDPELFNPDRFSPEESKKRNMYAFLPFSHGPRSCIGQQLSMMEQKFAPVYLMPRFCFRVDNEKSRDMSITSPLFLSVTGLYMKVSRRVATSIPRHIRINEVADEEDEEEKHGQALVKSGKHIPLWLLYGSNMGTSSELVSQKLAPIAKAMDFNVTVMTLDDFSKLAPPGTELKKGAVVTVCSTYNGFPPDNAASFMAWLTTPTQIHEARARLEGVKFAVFGVGNSQWANTFQKVPKQIDSSLSSLGGERILPMSFGDAAADLSSQAGAWMSDLWPALHKSLKLDFKAPEKSKESLDLFVISKGEDYDEATLTELVERDYIMGRVLVNRELQDVAKSGRSTRHIEVSLPHGVEYSAGDHLEVIPKNPWETVEAWTKRLCIDPSEVVTVRRKKNSTATLNSRRIPFGIPVPIAILLQHCVEIQATVTQSSIAYLAQKPELSQKDRSQLQDLASDQTKYDQYIRSQKKTLLEVLNDFPSVNVSLAEAIALHPPLKPRFYSISSSPKTQPRRVSICVGLVEGKSPTGRHHVGACSGKLCGSGIFAPMRYRVKDTKSTFRLPENAAVPIIMIGPGTGIAPMMGFIQERVATNAPGEMMLFFGCRDEYDYLFKDQLEALAKAGKLTLSVAFSRKDKQKTYVQNKLAAQGKAVWNLLAKGAHIYICGDASRMAVDVRRALVDLIAQHGNHTLASAEAYLSAMVDNKKFCQDVWASQS